MTYAEIINQRLRQAILDSGMSYQKLADKAEMHYNTVSNYMGTKHIVPSVESLGKLCMALAVSADWVLGLAEKDTAVLEQAIEKFGKTTQMIVAIEELSELQKELCKLLRGMKNWNHLAEELADVSIVLDELFLMFPIRDAVQDWREKKIARLQERMVEDGA